MKLNLSPVVQISLSTAEESLNYFTGNEPRVWEHDVSAIMPSGTYRIY